MEEIKANLIVALLSSFVGALISLFIIPEWILYLIFIALVLVAVLTIFVLYAITKKFNVSLAAKSKLLTEVSSNELSRLQLCLKELEREKSKPKRLPAVFGRLIDDSLQQLLDLSLRDFVGAWNAEQGFGSSNQFVQDVKEDLWKIVQNLQERLSKIDIAKLICVDFINRFLNHFEQIRLVKSSTPQNKQPAYNLLPHLSSIETEKDYLRQITSALLVLLFPTSYSSAEPVKHLLREIITCKVLFPTIEAVTHPDFINEKILAYMELNHPRTAHLENDSYERPESYEDLIKIIRNSNDIEVLKQIRYDIVSDIMAATNLQNLKQAQSFDLTPSSVVGISSKLLHPSQTKHIVNYLAAKSLCEKRLHALGWKGYPDEELEEAVEASSIVGKEPLPLLMVLNNVKGRLFLSEYLKKNESPDLIGFWTSVEQLRLSKRCNWHDLGAEIFYTYIHTPSAPIKTDKAMVKRMEAFLLGDDNGPEVFYEQQDAVLHALEKLYSSFLLTDLYPKMLTALESPDVEDVHSADELLASAIEQPLSEETEDKSNYSRRKLAELQERLKNKEQALQALRTSLKPESRVLAQLEAEVEGLKGEMRQLEAHVVRTDAWGEHLGLWRVVVQNAEMSEDKEWPQFVLVVHILEDDRDSDSISTGWVVLRKLHDFHDLHRKLCQLNSDVKQLELPSQLKFRLGKSTVKNALEKAKIQTQKFLQFVLEDERLNQCEALYTFLSPSSDHLKQTEPTQKKQKFSLSAMFKSGGWEANIFRYPSPKIPIEEDISLLVDETEGLKSLGESTDAIAEPLYSLLNELCDLNTTFKWIRRTLITTVQLTYNRTINRAVRVIIADLFCEQNVYGYIQIFIKSWWPNGQFNQTLTHRTAEEKIHIRQEVREHFLGNIPLILSNLVGHQNARLGATKVFDALQDPLLNKQIFYELIGVLLSELCPELQN